MEIQQRRFSNRIGYVFGDDEVHYSVQDSSGSRSFSVAYGDIGRDRQALTERNQWLRNAGLLWGVLGLVLTVMSSLKYHAFAPSFWLWVGMICYCAYHLVVTHYLIIPTEKGNLLVIKNADGERIVAQIEQRRASYLRREYDVMLAEEHPEQRRNRFKWLHREGVLSSEELEQRLQQVDARDPALLVVQQVLSGNQLP
ncbi:hypothetical protein JR064_06335 [Xanthomonas sp. CFBP 8703]|uniref:Uncharacterized protein n=1 Tax=Xanthomonas bonasiae TaxID=2810351 RepID=A0ABS3B001_9XANT|nr:MULTISPECIES: hypothetical protein [Xanthomonas]MBD7923032.1 hypothetical protein [Xanthomonas surreyensis]MBN6101782.1 hypothetical protein [Xanthomonas bonasiae]MBN6114268.1 hypothetical protein [Xanthomonas bonasiae]